MSETRSFSGHAPVYQPPSGGLRASSSGRGGRWSRARRSRPGGLRTGLAEADDGEMREAGHVAEPPAYRPPHLVELVGRDRGEGGTSLTGQVLLLALGGDRVEARAVTEMDVADDAQALERLEVAVHRGDVRGRNPASHAVGDLLGREWAVGGEQRREDDAPRG